ncbi:hypothetical protein [Streptomyces sp. NPDC003996]
MCQRGLATPLGVEFAPPHRADRIRALLEARRTWTPLLDHLAALDDLTPGSKSPRRRWQR